MLGSALLAGCSTPGGPESTVPETGIIIVDTTALVADPAPDGTVEDTLRDAAEEAEVVPAGSATLTIGERTWTFPDVRCLFDEDAAQVEADFAMSAVADGFEVYAATTADGHLVTIVDISGDEEEPVSLTTNDTTRFIRISDATVTAAATFVPVEDPDAPGVEGTLDADCA